jgi:hypothetical protein
MIKLGIDNIAANGATAMSNRRAGRENKPANISRSV